MIQKEELLFREADIKRCEKKGKHPHRRRHVTIECDECGTVWLTLKNSFLKSRSFKENNSFVSKYKPNPVRVPIMAGINFNDQIEMPNIENEREISQIKRPSLPLFSG